MVLTGKGKVTGHPKARSLYILIPSKIATDSQCPFKRGDYVSIKIEGNKVIIEKIEGDE